MSYSIPMNLSVDSCLSILKTLENSNNVSDLSMYCDIVIMISRKLHLIVHNEIINARVFSVEIGRYDLAYSLYNMRLSNDDNADKEEKIAATFCLQKWMESADWKALPSRMNICDVNDAVMVYRHIHKLRNNQLINEEDAKYVLSYIHCAPFSIYKR
jgi:hypothetical protein